jgi:hypothetical protein
MSKYLLGDFAEKAKDIRKINWNNPNKEEVIQKYKEAATWLPDTIAELTATFYWEKFHTDQNSDEKETDVDSKKTDPRDKVEIS